MPDFNDPRLSLPSAGSAVMQVSAGVTALRKSPEAGAELVSQVLHGEQVTLHQEDGDFALIQNMTDRYVGWARKDALSAPAMAITHHVSALRLYAYPEPTIKASPRDLISIGAGVVSEGKREGRFLKCERAGWICEDQLRPVGSFETDPADVALRYLHAPYLWGGRESLGIDCSGLVQQAFGACGVILPRDSDMQASWTGEAIEDWQAPGMLTRNDLIFWPGHVGILLDAKTLLHANAHHMCVAVEPLAGSIARIEKQYGAPIGARRINIASSRGVIPDWRRV